MDTNVRLRTASHIHFALLRHYGVDVPVGTLLRGGEAAREALWVCEASEQDGLPALASQLRGFLAEDRAARAAALRAAEPTAAAGAPQDAPWAHNTSGFGVTRPAGDEATVGKLPSSGWLATAVGWRKRTGTRSPR